MRSDALPDPLAPGKPWGLAATLGLGLLIWYSLELLQAAMGTSIDRVLVGLRLVHAGQVTKATTFAVVSIVSAALCGALVIAAARLRDGMDARGYLGVGPVSGKELARWLRKLDPTIRVDASTRFVANEEKQAGAPFVHLFRDGRTVSTILLWVVNFMNLLVLYSLSNWLPIVVTGMGYPTQTAVLVSTVLQVGGTIGTFGLAWLIARAGFIPMLATTFAIATLSIALIGQPGISLAMLTVIVFVAGWGVIGGQPGVNALSATYYPTSLRTTGVGWGLGVGRIGAIVGPYLGGKLLQWQRGTQELFWAAAVPALISTITMVALLFTMKLPATTAAAQRPAPAAH